MEIVVTARHTEVADRFRRHAEEKLAKVEQLAPRAHRIDVQVSHEKNRRQANQCERVELTVLDKGPVIRAEACANDVFAALDLAHAKLLERLRRARDRRKVHHGRRTPTAVHEATNGVPPAALDDALLNGGAGHAEPEQEQDATSSGPLEAIGDSPVVIREKVHPADPITLDEALYQMELVGHDFYLFVDKATGHPSVVYRRRGWNYGVIRLGESGAEESSTPAAAGALG